MSSSQAPEGQHCVGPQSAEAGKADSCAGCPNRAICASGAARQPDPDVELIRNRLRGVRARVLVLSGKGGVGKSTMTKELAYALAHTHGLNVGIVDADLCGPSQPRMLGVRDEGEPHRSALGLEPVAVDEGVSLMSIHFLLNEASTGGRNQSVTWRGPQKNGMLKTFLRDVDWTGSGALDVLLIDTPPGTTDEHITLATLLMQVQKLEEEEAAANGTSVPPTFTGAVVVTTPQTVAIADVRRELTFCEKARVPVLGLIENMSGFVCPCCGLLSSVFGGHATNADAAAPPRGASSGVSALAKEFNVPVLGAVPLDPAVMIACEQGIPLSSVDMAAALREVTTPAPGHTVSADAGGATLEALDAISAAIVSQVPCLAS